MTRPRGLGRGLDALLGGPARTSAQTSAQASAQTSDRTAESQAASQAGPGSAGPVMIALDALAANPDQPRREFVQEALDELAASIREQGVLQPIIVRPAPVPSGPARYQIVAGERRFRASTLAGLKEIPAIVRELDDRQTLIVALAENLQREDLNPVEEAQGYARLKELLDVSQEELAARIGKSRSAVANALRLLRLPEAMRNALASERMTSGHARALLALDERPEAMNELFERVLAESLSVRQTEFLSGEYKRAGEAPPEASKAAATRAPAASAPVEDGLDGLRVRLASSLGLPVTIRSKATSAGPGGRLTGTLSVSFSSREQLAALAALLDPEGGRS